MEAESTQALSIRMHERMCCVTQPRTPFWCNFFKCEVKAGTLECVCSGKGWQLVFFCDQFVFLMHRSGDLQYHSYKNA